MHRSADKLLIFHGVLINYFVREMQLLMQNCFFSKVNIGKLNVMTAGGSCRELWELINQLIYN